MIPPDPLAAYWSLTGPTLLELLGSDIGGLADGEAQRRLAQYGPNDVDPPRVHHWARLLLRRAVNPLALLLLLAACLSALMREWMDAAVVTAILAATTAIGTWQEHRASHVVAALRRQVTMRSQVLRAGRIDTVPSATLVPGDLVLLSAGNLIPADAVVLDARDLFVDQALLSGETFAVDKRAGVSAASAPLARRSNCVFAGTSVRSGTATALVVRTALATEFGMIAGAVAGADPETDFEKGLRRFGAMLVSVMLLIVTAVLAVNIMLGRASADTLLFAIALAVGLSPELLPAILTVTLARASQKMAAAGVIVKRLNAIENLGGMNVLCTDKTGTLTRGVARLDQALDPDGVSSQAVRQMAYLNAQLQAGLANPLDEAIAADARAHAFNVGAVRKRDEIPYDFQRRRLSVVIDPAGAGAPLLLTKGAFQNVLDACDSIARGDAATPLGPDQRAELGARFDAWSGQGFRVLGMARRTVAPKAHYTQADEAAMVFCGFLLFFDPPEPGVADTLRDLARLGVQLKIITGDNHAVARHVAEAVGINAGQPLTGGQISAMSDDALVHHAARANLFAEVDPQAKERIVRALQRTGKVVGFLGDGINDAPALHCADVGLSVDRAADVAREAADFVLLKHDLALVRLGIEEGRRTFANTLKYIFITTSANFGNMVSMAAATLALPFLPLLASQVLLNNFLSDIPALGLAGDNVDPEWETRPHRWDVHLIRNFMVYFGLVSTLFDLVTFGALLWLAGAAAPMFRTGWFVESLLTELLILVVIRTYRPFYKSRPSAFVTLAIVLVAAIAIGLPYSPAAHLFGLVPLPAPILAAVLAITACYVLLSEATKRLFYRRSGLLTP